MQQNNENKNSFKMTVKFLIYKIFSLLKLLQYSSIFPFSFNDAQCLLQQYKFPWTALQKVMACLKLLSDSLK